MSSELRSTDLPKSDSNSAIEDAEIIKKEMSAFDDAAGSIVKSISEITTSAEDEVTEFIDEVERSETFSPPHTRRLSASMEAALKSKIPLNMSRGASAEDLELGMRSDSRSPSRLYVASAGDFTIVADPDAAGAPGISPERSKAYPSPSQARRRPFVDPIEVPTEVMMENASSRTYTPLSSPSNKYPTPTKPERPVSKKGPPTSEPPPSKRLPLTPAPEGSGRHMGSDRKPLSATASAVRSKERSTTVDGDGREEKDDSSLAPTPTWKNRSETLLESMRKAKAFLREDIDNLNKAKQLRSSPSRPSGAASTAGSVRSSPLRDAPVVSTAMKRELEALKIKIGELTRANAELQDELEMAEVNKEQSALESQKLMDEKESAQTEAANIAKDCAAMKAEKQLRDRQMEGMRQELYGKSATVSHMQVEVQRYRAGIEKLQSQLIAFQNTHARNVELQQLYDAKAAECEAIAMLSSDQLAVMKELWDACVVRLDARTIDTVAEEPEAGPAVDFEEAVCRIFQRHVGKPSVRGLDAMPLYDVPEKKVVVKDEPVEEMPAAPDGEKESESDSPPIEEIKPAVTVRRTSWLQISCIAALWISFLWWWFVERNKACPGRLQRSHYTY